MGNREELAILETEYLIAYMYEMDFVEVEKLFDDTGLPEFIRRYPSFFTYSFVKADNETKHYLERKGITLPKKKHDGVDYMRSDKRIRVSVFREEFEKGIIYPETMFIIEKDFSVTPLPTQ